MAISVTLCLSVSPLAYLKNHTTNFTIISVQVVQPRSPLVTHTLGLYTSSFMDDVIFTFKVQKLPNNMWYYHEVIEKKLY